MIPLLKERPVQVATATIATAAVLKWTVSYLSRRKALERLEQRAADLRKKRDESIHWARRMMLRTDGTERERIAKMDYNQLQDALQSGDVTAVAALCTYLELAVKAHEKTNCVTLFLQSSFSLAVEWDKKAIVNGEKRPPLFGIPISVKEALPVSGETSTFGGALEYPPHDVDGVYVEAAKRNGAIPFVYTNVPLALMAFDTVNAVYGQTTNPLSSERSPGGSSGGEAALIGMGGSLLGFGSDLAGSIREPAAYCGVAGFKPTAQRSSLYGYQIPVPGRPLVWPTDGPLASSIHSCALIMRLLWEDDFVHQRDVYAPPVLWRDELFNREKKYRIGFLIEFGTVKPLPSQKRAVMEAKAALEKIGYEVVPFSSPPMDYDELERLVNKAMLLDGGEAVSQMLDAELCPDVYKKYQPECGRSSAINRFCTRLGGMFGLSHRYKYTKDFCKTAADAQNVIQQTYTYRYAFSHAMKEAGVDAILCPPANSPALHCETPIKLHLKAFLHTHVYNLLDFPAGCVKVGCYNDEDDRAMQDYHPKNEEEYVLKEESKGMKGLPLSVQVVSPIYRDEVALRVLCDLEDALF